MRPGVFLGIKAFKFKHHWGTLILFGALFLQSCTPQILGKDSAAKSTKYTARFDSMLAVIRGGFPLTINFTIPSGIVSSTLSVSVDGGTTFTKLADLNSADTSYTWDVPTLDNMSVRFQIKNITSNHLVKTSESTVFAIDSTPPAAPVISLVSNSLSKQQASTLSVANCDDTSMVLVAESNAIPALDSSQWQACSTVVGAITKNLSAGDGAKVLYAFAKDAAGNISPASSPISVTLDMTAPVLATASVTNANPTNVTAFALSFGAITGDFSSYCILENSTEEGNCSYTAGALPTSFTVSSTNGPKVLSVWLKDLAGNISNRVDTASITLDTLQPDVPVLTLTSPTITHLGSAVFTASPCNAADKILISESSAVPDLSATGWQTCSSGVAGFTLALSAGDGIKSFYAYTKDAAGNISGVSNGVSVELDTVAPILASVTVSNSNPTNSRTFGLSYGLINGTYSSYCILENNLSESACAYVTGTLPSSYTVSSSNGLKTLSFWLKDLAGNKSDRVESAPVTLDTVAPILASASVSNGSPTRLSNFNLTYGSITGEYSRYCILENNTVESNCSYAEGSLPSTFSVSDANGPKVLSIWLKDLAGNVSNRVDTASVILDTVQPDVPVLTLTSPASTHLSSAIFSASPCSANDQIFISESIAIPDISANGWQTCLNPSVGYTRTLSAGEGVKTFYAYTKDAAGNISSLSNGVSVELDTTAPVLASAALTNPNPTNTTNFSLSYGAITGAYDSYCILENNKNANDCSFIQGTLPDSFTVSNTNNDKSLSIWIKDAADNLSDRVDTGVITLDTTPPVTPGTITLVPVSNPPVMNFHPLIRVSGVTPGDAISLYQNDNKCSETNRIGVRTNAGVKSSKSGSAPSVSQATNVDGTITATSDTVDFIAPVLKAGDYTFYARSKDTAGNLSPCSSSKLDYHYASVLLASSSDGSPLGEQNDGQGPTISSLTPDGKYVVFSSAATNFVNGASGTQIYRKNMVSGQIDLVSSIDGTALTQDTDGRNSGGQITADGRYVLFQSYSPNLINDGSFTGPLKGQQIFLKDMNKGDLYILTSDDGSLAHQGNADSTVGSVSSDGRYVVFSSTATNLVSGGATSSQVYLYDLTLHSILLASSYDGSIANQGDEESRVDSGFGNVTPDGRYVLFQSRASNLIPGVSNVSGHWQTYRMDLVSHQMVLVSSLDGTVDTIANHDTFARGITPDGRYALLSSFASNFSNLGENEWQVYRKDLLTGALLLASSVDGTADKSDLSGTSIPMSMSADGRFVTFSSFGDNFISGSRGIQQVYQKDFETNKVSLVSSYDGSASQIGNCASDQATSSPDGLFVLFNSCSDNLVPTTNGQLQAFLRFMTPDPRVMITSPIAESVIPESVTVSGLCSEEDQTVAVQVKDTPISSLISCKKRTWSVTLDLSQVNHGPVTITADIQNILGAHALQASRSFSLVSPNLLTAAITNQNQNHYVNTGVLNLNLGIAGDYAQYCILENDSESAHCQWTLGQIPSNYTASTEGSLTLTIWVQDGAGNTSSPLTLPAVTIKKVMPPTPTGLALLDPGTSPSNIGTPRIQVTGTVEGTAVNIFNDPNCSPSNWVGSTNADYPAQNGTTDVVLGGLPAFIKQTLYAQASDLGGGYLSGCFGSLEYEYDPDGLVLVSSKDGTKAQMDTSNNMRDAVLTPDGKYVVFSSYFPYLSGMSKRSHIYRKNLQTGVIELVDSKLGTARTQNNGDSTGPQVSPDGRYILFSAYGNLTGITLNSMQVFLKDMRDGTLTLVSSRDGTNLTAGNLASNSVALTPDARYAFFISAATNLFEGAVNWQFYRKDLVTGDLTLVSSIDGSADTELLEGYQGSLSASVDGRFVAFSPCGSSILLNNSTGYCQVARKDLDTGEILTVSAPDGDVVTPSYGPASLGMHSMSDDGRYVLFFSQAGNLIPGASNTWRGEIYIKDLQTRSTRIVSSTDDTYDSGYNQGMDSDNLSLSPDARYAIFHARAMKDMHSDTAWQIYRKDLFDGTLDFLSSTDGTAANASDQNALQGSITPLGRYGIFIASSSTFLGQDKAGIFLRRLSTQARVSITYPAENTLLDSSNAKIKGYCSEEGQVVKVLTSGLEAQATCQYGMWSVGLDLSGIAPGSIDVSAFHYDLGGKEVRADRKFQLGTPEVLSLTVANAGLNAVKSPTLSLLAPVMGDSYDRYCILENNTDQNACVWLSGPIPTTYSLTNTSGDVTLSIWTQTSGNIVSNRADSKPIHVDVNAPQLTSATVTNPNPTSSTIFKLSYGPITGGSYSRYCILENDKNLDHCNFTVGNLPGRFYANSTKRSKVLSIWIKDSAGNISTRVDTNAVTYDNTLKPSLASVTINNASPSHTRYFQVSLGATSGEYNSICINENDTEVNHCNQWWNPESFPSQFKVSGSNGAKVFSVWLRNEAGVNSDRVDSNSVEYVNADHIIAVGAGNSHECSVNAEGAVDCFGYNADGQVKWSGIDQPQTLTALRMSPESQVGVANGFSCAVNGGALYCWGSNGSVNVWYQRPDLISENFGSGVTGFAGGDSHACAIVYGGLKCWGNNAYGMIGSGQQVSANIPINRAYTVFESGVSKVVAGSIHTCAIVNSDLFCWGYNGNGQIGNGNAGGSNVATPFKVLSGGVTDVAVSNNGSCAIQSGALVCWGYHWPYSNNSPEVQIPSGVTGISMGEQHLCAVVSGALQCEGTNSYSSLGDGTPNASQDFETIIPSGVTATTAKLYTTCAIVNGDLQCWGYNSDGQVGNGKRGMNASVPTTILKDVTTASLGRDSGCAVQSGSLKCWGNNGLNQLGIGRTDMVLNPKRVIDSGATAVAGGQSFTCAIVNGDLQCWGGNVGNGSVGNNDLNSLVPHPVTILSGGVTAISAKNYTGCAIQNGALKCWGSNGNGQLGTGDTNRSLVPITVFDSGVSAVSMGGNHTCAIKDSALYCWGYNYYGQIGNGLSSLVSGFNQDVLTPYMVFSIGVTAVSAGDTHTCAVVDHQVLCWGGNYNGQMGLGLGSETTVTLNPVTVMSATSETQLTSGALHTCALTSGAMTCWGFGGAGQMGTGSYYYTNNSGQNSSSYPPTQIFSSGVTGMATAYGSTCAVLSSGKLQCWGQNNYGQLGTGDQNQSPIPIDVVY